RIRFEHGDAARIVATVFEAPQSFDQHRNDITLRNCADNAAHEKSTFYGKRVPYGTRMMLSFLPS
ncbi:hypothetical protein KTE91_30810, partial [Burkholderia multivorans]|uniref:hypothetical protein n=1 Tax=Burkholderia multivorans TaxID=87883 RepID=UPI001C248A55